MLSTKDFEHQCGGLNANGMSLVTLCYQLLTRLLPTEVDRGRLGNFVTYWLPMGERSACGLAKTQCQWWPDCLINNALSNLTSLYKRCHARQQPRPHARPPPSLLSLVCLPFACGPICVGPTSHYSVPVAAACSISADTNAITSRSPSGVFKRPEHWRTSVGCPHRV